MSIFSRDTSKKQSDRKLDGDKKRFDMTSFLLIWIRVVTILLIGCAILGVVRYIHSFN